PHPVQATQPRTRVPLNLPRPCAPLPLQTEGRRLIEPGEEVLGSGLRVGDRDPAAASDRFRVRIIEDPDQNGDVLHLAEHVETIAGTAHGRNDDRGPLGAGPSEYLEIRAITPDTRNIALPEGFDDRGVVVDDHDGLT